MSDKILLLVVTLLITSCNSVFFHPVKEQIVDPDAVGIKYEARAIKDENEPTLNAWLLRSTGAPKATILHLHGNAENISTHVGSVYWLPKEGFNVFTFDYRGYGASEGEPTFEGLHHDAERALKYISSDPELNKYPIILFGQSLGGSIALYVASKDENKKLLTAVIAESPFKGYRNIARDKLKSFWLSYPFSYPLSFLVSADFDSSDIVSKISPLPLLIIHPLYDQTVPYYHGSDLYKLAKEPKEIWSVPKGDHITTLNETKYRTYFLTKLNTFLE